MPFPHIDPVAFHLGPFAIHWYGLAYVAGILGWWQYSLLLTKKFPLVDKKMIDDFLAWAIVGVILGGRLGYVLFYNPEKYLASPIEVFEVWKGGMAFHGGLLGVIIATAIYTYKRGLYFFNFTDLACCGIPIGLFFGRLANFINGELYGRVTDSPWGMIFPNGGLLIPPLRYPGHRLQPVAQFEELNYARPHRCPWHILPILNPRKDL